MSNDLLIEVPRPRFAEWLVTPMRRNSSVYLRVAVAAVLVNLLDRKSVV